MSGALPPGFRFHPTDEELVGYYLKRKVQELPFELEVIPVIDLYKFDPWELPEKSLLPGKDMEWFFFCPRDRKHPNGSRTNRATKAGYWKATGKDRRVVCQSSVSGYRKTLVFYTGRAPLGDRTDWVMHEYRLCDDNTQRSPSFQGAFSLCRIMKRNEPHLKTNFVQEPLAKGSAYHSHNADSTASRCLDKPMSTSVDMTSQASYMCYENQLSSPFTSHSRVTPFEEFEPASMDTWTACQQVSPDLILDSSKEYSQVQETCSESIVQYQILSSLTSWQREQNCETSLGSSHSNFTGQVEYGEDITRFGCASPYSRNPYYMGYYGNEYIPYGDHDHSSSLQYPEPF